VFVIVVRKLNPALKSPALSCPEGMHFCQNHLLEMHLIDDLCPKAKGPKEKINKKSVANFKF
jgi:hypothetical protein